MTTKNGQVAWLSAKNQRVFLNYEDALEDAQQFNFFKYGDNSESRAYNDVYLIHLWLNGKKQKPCQKEKRI